MCTIRRPRSSARMASSCSTGSRNTPSWPNNSSRTPPTRARWRKSFSTSVCAMARPPSRRSAPCTRIRWMLCSRPRRNAACASIAGKCLMDRHCPPALSDTAQRGYDESKALIGRWHGKGRASYAITPRFAPTSTPEQMELAGALVERAPRHVSAVARGREPRGSRVGARALPRARGLSRHLRSLRAVRPARHLRPRHLADRDELARMHESGTAIAHCPTSNMFLGSGLFDLRKAKQAGAARARRACHRCRRGHLALDAADHGRGLPDGAALRQ